MKAFNFWIYSIYHSAYLKTHKMQNHQTHQVHFSENILIKKIFFEERTDASKRWFTARCCLMTTMWWRHWFSVASSWVEIKANTLYSLKRMTFPLICWECWINNFTFIWKSCFFSIKYFSQIKNMKYLMALWNKDYYQLWNSNHILHLHSKSTYIDLIIIIIQPDYLWLWNLTHTCHIYIQFSKSILFHYWVATYIHKYVWKWTRSFYYNSKERSLTNSENLDIYNAGNIIHINEFWL